MKKVYSLIVGLLVLVLSGVSANTYYVSPSGVDTNNGTISAPFLTLHKAVSLVVAGDTIFMRGGTHVLGSLVPLSQKGTATDKICLFNYPNEKPVLDFSTQPYGFDYRALMLTGDYWYIKGLEITKAGDNAIKVEGNYNRIELCVLHHNGDSGIQLGFGHKFEDTHPGISTNNGTYCAYNEIINCDSYYNYDYDTSGGDADGFACKMHNGKGNVFKGCRAWHNSDDGWDLYETDYSVVIDSCWTWHNADKADFLAWHQAFTGKAISNIMGNGNGFKLGGNGTGGSSTGVHTLTHSIAFNHNYGNAYKGIDQNSHDGGVICYNNLSFGNRYNYMFENSASPADIFKNNVSMGCVGSLDHEFAANVVLANNSWSSLEGNASSTSATWADYDFTAAEAEQIAMSPRKADGSLPDIRLGKLKPNSKLIDAGTNVGFNYSGVAPDLGPFEYVAPNGLSSTIADNSFTYWTEADALKLAIIASKDGNGTIQFYDLSGKIIVSQLLEVVVGGNILSVNCSTLPSGLIVFKLNVGDKFYSGKISK